MNQGKGYQESIFCPQQQLKDWNKGSTIIRVGTIFSFKAGIQIFGFFYENEESNRKYAN